MCICFSMNMLDKIWFGFVLQKRVQKTGFSGQKRCREGVFLQERTQIAASDESETGILECQRGEHADGAAWLHDGGSAGDSRRSIVDLGSMRFHAGCDS